MTVKRKTWDEFRASGLLWFINRLLHVWGWAIVVTTDEQDRVTEAYPAMVDYRGFDEATNEAGYIALTNHTAGAIPRLLADVTSKKHNEQKGET